MNRCTGAGCRQGRDACPTPDACHIAEPEPINPLKDAALAIVLVVICLLIAEALSL